MFNRFFVTCILLGVSLQAWSYFNLEGTPFEAVGRHYDIDPLLLYSIAITESAAGVGQGLIQPQPYVFRTDEGPRYFSDKQSAAESLAIALERTNNIDIGMMQINLKYHPQHDPMALLDPIYNLHAAAEYLKTAMASTEDPIIGVGRYHSWTPALSDWYGQRVWATYNNLYELMVFSG